MYKVSVNGGDSVTKSTNCVRNLGALLESTMDMEQQVKSVCRSAYAQLRSIGHIRNIWQMMPQNPWWIASYIENGLLQCGVKWYNTVMHKLQRVQNTAARVITRTSRYSRITSVLNALHWLPLKYRALCKTLTFTYKALHDQSPDYIREMLKVYKPSRTLGSQDSWSLVVPSARTEMFWNPSFAYLRLLYVMHFFLLIYIRGSSKLYKVVCYTLGIGF